MQRRPTLEFKGPEPEDRAGGATKRPSLMSRRGGVAGARKSITKEKSSSRMSFKLVPSGGANWKSGISSAAKLAGAWVEARRGGDTRAQMSKQVIDVFVRGVPYQNCSGCKLAVKDSPSTLHTHNVGWCHPDQVIFVHTALEKTVPGRTGNRVPITFLCLSNEKGWLHTPFPPTRRTLFRRIRVSHEEWADPSSPPQLFGDPDGSLFKDLQTLAEAREVGNFNPIDSNGLTGQFSPSKIDKIFRPKAVSAMLERVASEDAVRKEAARDIFDDFDADNSDSIDRGELKELGRSLGLSLTSRTAGLLLKQIDSSGSGEVSFEEFWAWFRTMDQPQRRGSTANGYFKILQQDMPSPDPMSPPLSPIGSMSPLDRSSPTSGSPSSGGSPRGGNLPFVSARSLRRFSLAITASLDKAVDRKQSSMRLKTKQQASAFCELDDEDASEEEEGGHARKSLRAEAVEAAVAAAVASASVEAGATASASTNDDETTSPFRPINPAPVAKANSGYGGPAAAVAILQAGLFSSPRPTTSEAENPGRVASSSSTSSPSLSSPSGKLSRETSFSYLPDWLALSRTSVPSGRSEGVWVKYRDTVSKRRFFRSNETGETRWADG